MVSHCANPRCCKPLHYLREGRIFLFEVPDPKGPAKDGKLLRRTEHFWLCGSCSESFLLEQNSDRSITITSRSPRRRRGHEPVMPAAIAS